MPNSRPGDRLIKQMARARAALDALARAAERGESLATPFQHSPVARAASELAYPRVDRRLPVESVSHAPLITGRITGADIPLQMRNLSEISVRVTADITNAEHAFRDLAERFPAPPDGDFCPLVYRWHDATTMRTFYEWHGHTTALSDMSLALQVSEYLFEHFREWAFGVCEYYQLKPTRGHWWDGFKNSKEL